MVNGAAFHPHVQIYRFLSCLVIQYRIRWFLILK